MKIFIGADHGGFELKSKIMTTLKLDSDISLVDCGAFELNLKDDYPIFAKAVITNISKNKDSLGILICKTGIGMCMAANRHVGIYAALCTSQIHAIKSRQHNNANVLCLDSEFISNEDNLTILKTFLETPFTNLERHIKRIQMF